MPRETIEVVVVGLEDLQRLNRAHTDYEKHLEKIKQLVYESANVTTSFSASISAQEAVVRKNAAAFNQLIRENESLKRSLQQVQQDTQKTTTGFNSLLKTALEYRTISLIFRELVQVVTATKDAMLDFDYQTSRVRRVTEGFVPTATVRGDMASEMARTGQGAKELGEAFYQLGTFIKDADSLFQAVQSTMTLVVGTEADVRDAARASIQVYNQFGQQMDKNVSQGEKLRRVNEAIAITYKNTQTEVSELIQTLKYLGPIAEAAGVPLAQVFGAVGGLEAGGIRGRMAGTSMAQLITQLMKRSAGQEGGDIKVGGYIYENVIKRTNSGGMDLIRTLEGIRDKLRELNLHRHAKEADEFVLAMGGTQNAIRAVGTLNETLDRMKKNTADVAEGFKGVTHESERLKDIMQDNLPAQMQKAWQGALAAMSVMFKEFADSIHLQGLFRDLGEIGKQATEGRQAQIKAGQMMGGVPSWQGQMAKGSILRGVLSRVGGEEDISAGELVSILGHGPGTDAVLKGIPRRTGLQHFDAYYKRADIEAAASLAEKQAQEMQRINRITSGDDMAFIAEAARLHAQGPAEISNIRIKLSPEEIEKRRKAAEAQARSEAQKLRDRARVKVDEANLISETARDAGRPLTQSEVARSRMLMEEYSALQSEADSLIKSARMNYKVEAARKIRQNETYNRSWYEERDKERYGYLSGIVRDDLRAPYTQAAMEHAKALDAMALQIAKDPTLVRQIIEGKGGAAYELGQARLKGVQVPGISFDMSSLLSDFGRRELRKIDLRPGFQYGVEPEDFEQKNLLDKQKVFEQTITMLGRTSDAAKPFIEDLMDIKKALEEIQNKKYGRMMTDSIEAARAFEKSIIDAQIETDKFREKANQRAMAEYQHIHDQIANRVGNAAVRIWRQGGGIGGAVKEIGDVIVETAIKRQAEQWLDPLITVTTNQIAALEGLTVAVDQNTGALTGQVPAGGKIGTSTKRGGLLPGKGDRYLGYGMAGYSIFTHGQEHGITLGGLLGSATAGAAIGGPIGAIIGGGLNLLGGLFHHKSNDPRQRNPAFFNAPSDFAYGAYIERATGKVDPAILAHVMKTNAPVVHVYIDGVEKKVRTVIQEAGSSGRAALVNTRVDLHSII